MKLLPTVYCCLKNSYSIDTEQFHLYQMTSVSGGPSQTILDKKMKCVSPSSVKSPRAYSDAKGTTILA